MDKISENVVLNNSQTMPMLGLGVYGMHGSEVEKAVENAIEIGYRLIDTATMYKNETEVGNAIKNINIDRKEVFITTKVDNIDHGFDETLKAYDESLKKLQVDYVDLYLIHWPIKGKRKETWKALEKLYTEGRIKSIGVANYLEPFLEEMKEYLEIIPAVNQVEFSPYLYQKSLLEYCQNLQIHLQAYTPLARGQRFDDEKLLKIADKYAKKPGQIMLRWLIQHGISAVPKSSNYERLKENFSIFDFQIDKSDMETLDRFNENLRVVPDSLSML